MKHKLQANKQSVREAARSVGERARGHSLDHPLTETFVRRRPQSHRDPCPTSSRPTPSRSSRQELDCTCADIGTTFAPSCTFSLAIQAFELFVALRLHFWSASCSFLLSVGARCLPEVRTHTLSSNRPRAMAHHAQALGRCTAAI